MKLKLNGTTPRSVLSAGLLAALMLLASCGGGDREQIFLASRVIAFGDELSVINSDGSKYSVNALATGSTTTLNCGANLLWVQSVAAFYGHTFPQCPGTVADSGSRIRASNGARVADLEAQIDQQLADGGLLVGDMVTLLVGANDVVAQFAQYPGVGEAQLLANVDAAGNELALQANRLADLGVKVLISTIPDMGLTPFAGDRSATSANPNPALLTRLSARFNDAMLARLTNDGRKIGLIQLDEYLQLIDKATGLGQGSYANSTLPACTVALPLCTTNTLVAGAVNAAWLWADSRRLSANGQHDLGSLAISRARNNPF